MLNQNYFLTRVRFYLNLKLKSSMSLPADSNSSVEELKRIHL